MHGGGTQPGLLAWLSISVACARREPETPKSLGQLRSLVPQRASQKMKALTTVLSAAIFGKRRMETPDQTPCPGLWARLSGHSDQTTNSSAHCGRSQMVVLFPSGQPLASTATLVPSGKLTR